MDVDTAVRHDRETEELALLARFARFARLDELALRAALTDLIHEEYDGEDSVATRQLVGARLHAWARLGRSDVLSARRLGATYDELFSELPAELAMRRAMAVQACVGTDFDDEERAMLAQVIPGIGRHVPPKAAAVATRPSANRQTDGVKRRRIPRIFRRFT